MRRAAWTVILLLGLVVAASMCGAGRVGYGGGYAGGYAGVLGPAYQAGGWRLSSRDTFTIVFTTQDVLTAGTVDTSKVGTASSPNAPWDSQRRDTFKFWLAKADTVHRLGAGFKVTNFAYGMVDTTEPEGYGLPSGDQVGLQAGIRTGSGPYSHNRTYNIAGRRSELFYIPFEKYIPAGVTVVDAFVNVSSTTNASATTADSIYANLVTTPDNKWYTVRRGGDRPDYSKMGWSRQISNNPTGSVMWSATNSDPWTPALSERAGFRSWGDVEDQTALPAAIASRQQVRLSITSCVQAAVSGATNNGIKLDLGWKSNAFQGAFVHAFWDDYSSALARTPYVVVRYVRKAYIGTADITAPPPPGALAATAGNGSVSLTWSTGGPGTSAFRVYRYFDGGTTSLVATSGVTFHVDGTAINGTKHFYRVSAIDASGNESALSSAASAVPGTIKVIPDPAYYALWFQDPGASLTSAQKDSLAAFDMIVTGPFPMEGGVSEPAYNGLLGDLRARNDDIVILSYIHPWSPRLSWETEAERTAQRKIWDWLDGEDAFAKTIGGSYIEGTTYPTRVANVMVPGVADAIARFWVAAFDSTGVDGEYAGLFVDDVVPDFPSFYCFSGACDDSLDMDQDGTPYSADSDEQEAWGQYNVDFATAVRREFAERGMANRILVANTTYTQHAEHDEAEDLLVLYDGSMNEGWNRWWPGNADDLDYVHWPMIETIADNFHRSQLAPAPVLWQSHIDSSLAYVSEPVALAARGWVCAQNNYSETWGKYGNKSIPAMVRRLGDPGTFTDVTIQSGAGSDPDTLTATYSNMTARLALSRNLAAAATDTFAVWPYLVTTADGTILSRSAFWELPEEVGAPSLVIQLQPGGEGDRQNTLAWEITSGSLPSDFAGWRIYRDPCDGCTDFIYDDNPTVYYSAEFGQAYSWTDTAVTNGVQYEYQIAAVDHNGQESDPAASDPMTPYDDTAPAAPQNLVASGGPGYIDLDWSNVTAADLIGYEVSRSFDGGAFAVTDTVTVSAHQDSTALEANEYTYRVRALDDDDNRSAYSGTVTAAWYGDPDPPASPPPSNVMAWPDTPQGRTSVVVYAPADTTGLTGYQVFRGSVADTGSLALYKNNIAVGQFAGAVFEDNKANSDPDTTWYYTAKAMYGAARSEKFHTPRGALTTGNYPSMVPVASATGSGALSAIVVAWSQIAGSDSTEIYRGTTAGSQTRIATVAHAANPYYDTGAAANTDYYYKVRYKDNPGTYTAYSAVAGPARWTSVPSGDPLISGATGTMAHGQSVVIAGSGFGARVVEDEVFDFVNGGFSDQWDVVDDTNLWYADYASGTDAIRHSGSSGALHYDFNGDSSDAYTRCDPMFSAVTSQSWYASYWFKLSPNWTWGTVYSSYLPGCNLINVKWMRFSEHYAGLRTAVDAGTTVGGVQSWIAENITCTTGDCVGTYPGGYFWGGYQSDWTLGEWHHVQAEYRDSGIDTPDGVFRIWFDGEKVLDKTNVTTRSTASPGLSYAFGVGFYNAWRDGIANANDYWEDDIVASPTWARVEIGNASTYGACTHREVQQITAWSATSVSITVNSGSFPTGTAYLFVVDGDGTASAGYPVTIE